SPPRSLKQISSASRALPAVRTSKYSAVRRASSSFRLASTSSTRCHETLPGFADELSHGIEEHRYRDRLGGVSLATAFATSLLIAPHGEGGDRDHGDLPELIVLLERFRYFEAGHFGKLNVHEDEVGAMLAGERQRLHAVSRLQRPVAMSVEQIMKQLHV